MRPLLMVVRLFFQTVPLALGQVWANKTRAMLTMLGIIIGVGSVIAVVGGLTGMQRFVLGEFESFGARKMWVWGAVPDGLETVLDSDSVKLTVAEAELLADRSENIELVAPTCSTSEDVAYADELIRGVQVTGIWPEWHTVEDRQTLYGRPISRIDNEQHRPVALVNEVAIEELGLETDPTGEVLLVGGRRFLVVGVVETKESSLGFQGEPRPELFIPFETSKQMNPYTWTWFLCQITDTDRAADAMADTRFILRLQRGLTGDDPDTFGVQVIQNVIDQFNGVAVGIGAVALGVVSISLLVGGIGIMNIMLVSVSERTREIGLRKAVGARPLVVLLQFLVEAVVLCTIGGVIGLLAGFALVGVLRLTPDMPLDEAEVPAWAIALSLGFSASVGVIFGMFPAMKAARLNPIDALRHE